MSGAPVALPQLPWDELSRIAPLRGATPADAVCGRQPQHVAEPRNPEELAAVLNWANTNRAAVAARGGGSKLDWGNPPRMLDLVASTAGLNRIIEHAFDDMTATVEAGCTVANFQHVLGEHGQRLALDPLFPERATIGGVLAANDSGSLRTRFGSLRDLIIGITAALPDGTLARSGGKVVKNVAGYDLPKLFTGSLGTLGVIVQATFRLHPIPPATETFTARCGGPREANQFLLAVLDSTLATSALQLRAGRNRETHVDVRYEGVPAGIEVQVRRTEALAPARVAPHAGAWREREELWMRAAGACICKFSVLPTQIGVTCEQVDKLASELELQWLAVVQAVGIGLLRLDGDTGRLLVAINRLRGQLEASGGSLVVLRRPDELRDAIEVWGSAGSALPLMGRVKEQFDPAGILNPGRFVGGI